MTFVAGIELEDERNRTGQLEHDWNAYWARWWSIGHLSVDHRRTRGNSLSMQCPQCEAEAADEEWNCPSCRMNLYWASQHYADLAHIRDGLGLSTSAVTPSFLRASHSQAMNERPDLGERAETRVRQLARRLMRETVDRASGQRVASSGQGTRVE